MASTPTTLARAVAAELAEGVDADAFVASFTPTFRFLPLKDQRDLSALTVSVFVGGKESELESRSEVSERHQICIAIQQQAKESDTTRLELLMELVEQIEHYFRFRDLTDLPDAVWMGAKEQAAYEREQLERSIFAKVIRLEYVVC